MKKVMNKTKAKPIKFANPLPDNPALTNTTGLHLADGIAKQRLHVEMVPYTCWFSNVRDHATATQWSTIKEWCYKRAGYRCEVCDETGLHQGRKHNVEAHEIWDYNDETLTQTLIGLIALCPACHNVKHYGRSIHIGTDKSARMKLKEVNRWSAVEVVAHCNEAIRNWQRRSLSHWTLNMDYLKTEFNLDVQIHRVNEPLTDEELAKIKAMDDHVL